MSLHTKRTMNKDIGCRDAIAVFVFAILLMAFAAAVAGIALTWAWNIVFPGLLGWPAITAWQGIGMTTLVVIARLLLGIRYSGTGE